MGTRKDEAWLKKELSKVLGWDDMIVDGVVDTISKSTDRSEVDEIVEVGSIQIDRGRD